MSPDPLLSVEKGLKSTLLKLARSSEFRYYGVQIQILDEMRLHGKVCQEFDHLSCPYCW